MHLYVRNGGRIRGTTFAQAERYRHQVGIGVPCGLELDIMAGETLSTVKMWSLAKRAGGNILNIATPAFAARNSQRTDFARSGVYV